MSIPPGSLQVQYDLSDPASYPGTGNTIYDLSGNARDATKTGTVGFVSDGQASYLDLTGAGYFTSSSFLIPDASNWTFTGWFYCDEPLGSTGYYFLSSVTSITNDPTYGGSPFIAFGWAVPSVWAGSATQNRGSVWAPVQANLTHWYYITYTSNGTNTELYINGVSVGTQNQDTRILGTNMNLRLGSSPDSLEEAVGKLAYVEMYSDCLAAGDVLALYNATKSRFIVPVIEYDFSEPACYPGTGNTIFNLQPASYDFPIVNGATFVGAGSSSYFTFNGVNQHIGQGFSGGPGFGTTFTATVWVQANNGNIGSIWNSGFDSPLGREPGMYLNARAFSPDPGYADASFNFGIGYLDMASPQTIGDWFNLAYVADGTNVSLYVNGVLDSTGSQGGGQWAAGGFVLGAHLSSGGGVDAPFLNAKIGYYSAFDVALGSTQVSDIYNSQVSRFNPPPTPTVEYDFQNGSYPGTGTTITDLQGGDTNLTVGNGHWVSGAPNYFDLQGDTNLFNTSPGGSFSSTTFTVNCWYYTDFTNPTFYHTVWSIGLDGNPTRPLLATQGDNTMNIQWSFGYGIVPYTPTIGWHLFTFKTNGTTTSLFVDGVFQGSNSSSSGSVASPYTIRLGCGNNNSNNPVEFGYGKIGYWSYFDVALDAADILDIYNATSGSYPPAPPPPSSNGVGGRQFAQGFNG